MEAIILAGGLGTRLSHVVKDVPKAMAMVAGIPFLCHILDNISKKGIDKVIMAVGYKKESIINYFGFRYNNIEIVYSYEDKPLFTGGAIKKALNLCIGENVFVINGDTFFDVNFYDLIKKYSDINFDIVVAVKKMNNFDRYGCIELLEDKVIRFQEKQQTDIGIINGGIYYIKKNLLNNIREQKFSFEKDFMENKIKDLNIYSYESNGYFIDIGIEEDYKKANEEFEI